jgi:hypothetical protein
MRRFLLDALLKPGLATAFLVGFGGFFVFGGFQTSRVELHRSAAGSVDGTLTRSHFFGIYAVSRELHAVTRAVVETGESHPRFGISVAVSGVALLSPSGRTPIFAGMSNVHEAYKRRIAGALNEYILGEDRSFAATFAVYNLFGWVGLPFFLAGLYGLATWPLTIVTSWRRQIAAADGRA